MNVPETLSVQPNVPWSEQTLGQLREEYAYWTHCVEIASGFTSAKAADGFRKGVERWINRRESEKLNLSSEYGRVGNVV